MLNFCTLFNSLYLTRGVAMYNSLEATCPDFHLYIFAFDDQACQTLQTLRLSKATIIPLSSFEDERLLQIKETRTPGEYCWTCTPATIEYCLDTYQLPSCTYIDADLLFYKNPAVLLEEMGQQSVLITEHRYTPEYDQAATSGKYCVQFVAFKNNAAGRKVLTDWKEDCFEWCYARFEDGKFGDQKYLDSWTTRYDCIHELNHTGGGVAPWNVQQYSFTADKNMVTGIETSSGKQFDLIFYHYHDYKYCIANGCFLGHYRLTEHNLKIVYKPYILALEKVAAQLQNAGCNGTFHELQDIHRLRKSLRRMYKFYIRGHIGNHYRRSYITR
ncbi:hypothetical protein [Chitinophaga sp. HK235]|uniref:hypothetical protein n=1 Tax=Chitinophaga sp. HK235 TaxID=2952571 RepID=UPI001BA54979|nr:hypothetical protein [Chitinophaga sp. HK235]